MSDPIYITEPTADEALVAAYNSSAIPALWFTSDGSKVFHQQSKAYSTHNGGDALVAPIIFCRLANIPESTTQTANEIVEELSPAPIILSALSIPEEPKLPQSEVPLNTPAMCRLMNKEPEEIAPCGSCTPNNLTTRADVLRSNETRMNELRERNPAPSKNTEATPQRTVRARTVRPKRQQIVAFSQRPPSNLDMKAHYLRANQDSMNEMRQRGKRPRKK